MKRIATLLILLTVGVWNGSITAQGRIKLPAEYDEIATLEKLTKGEYLVRQGDKWGLWSSTYSKFYIPCMYHEIQVSGRYAGQKLYAVRTDDRWGLVSHSNEVYVPTTMRSIDYENEERYTLVAADGTVYSSDKETLSAYSIFKYLKAQAEHQPIFYIRFENAKHVVVDDYQVEGDFRNGAIGIRDRVTDKVRYLNTRGEWTQAPRNTAANLGVRAKYNKAHDFSQGLAAVQMPLNSNAPLKWGFIDKSGKMVIPAKFTNEPSDFSGGLALIHLTNDQYVFINKEGQVVTEEMDQATPFCNGYAFVSTDKGMYAIDSTLQIVNEDIPAKIFWFGCYDQVLEQQRIASRSTNIFSAQDSPASDPCLIDAQGHPYVIICEEHFSVRSISEDILHISYDPYGQDIDIFCDSTGQVIFMLERNKF